MDARALGSQSLSPQKKGNNREKNTNAPPVRSTGMEPTSTLRPATLMGFHRLPEGIIVGYIRQATVRSCAANAVG